MPFKDSIWLKSNQKSKYTQTPEPIPIDMDIVHDMAVRVTVKQQGTSKRTSSAG
jgi:hypothetical protein